MGIERKVLILPKPKRKRRSKPMSERKHKQLAIRLTPDEFAQIDTHCQAVGVTKTDFFRSLYEDWRQYQLREQLLDDIPPAE